MLDLWAEAWVLGYRAFFAPACPATVAEHVNKHAKLIAALWRDPTDTSTLRVLADAWAEAGDPRGEWVQLWLAKGRTYQRELRKKALLANSGRLVGPAGRFLREWRFGDNGLVARARCEADKLAEGIAEIEQLNPELWLTVTSLKKRATIAAVAKVSLSKLYFVAFTMGVIGSNAGSNLDDKALVGIAPAFRGVRRIALQARGFRDDCFGPEALRTFADLLDDVAFFALDHAIDARPIRPALPPIDDYLAVLDGHKAFKKATIVVGYKNLPKTQAAMRAFG